MTSFPGETPIVTRGDLVAGFMPEEAADIAGFVSALSSYLDLDSHVYGGELAARYLADRSLRPNPDRPLTDIDVLVPGFSAVDTNIVTRFLIAHHHASISDSGFYLAAIDPQTRITANIYSAPFPQYRLEVPLGFLNVPVSSTEGLLAATVWDLQRIVGDEPEPVRASQIDDIDMLLRIAHMETVEAAWQQLQHPDGIPFDQAIKDAMDAAALHPDLLVQNPSRSQPQANCTDCIVDSSYFPLADPEELVLLMDTPQ